MKNRRALFLLLSANMVSGFAQGISMLAIPWYFISILKTSSFFGLIYVVVTLGSLFWSIYAGALIDRYSRKNIFLVNSVIGGLVLLSVSVTGFALGYVPISLIVLVFAATIFIYNIHYPALYAFGQEITEKHRYGKINSYLEIQGQTTTILSGAFAAVLLQGTSNGTFNLLGLVLNLPFHLRKWELHQIFLMDGITYFIAFILISMIKYVPQTEKIIEFGDVLERVKSGYRYLRKNPLLLLFGNLTMSIFVILLVEVQLLMPLYISNHLKEKADVYASSEIYYALGALLSGFGVQWFFRKTSTVFSIIVLMFITVFILFVCAFTQSALIFFIFSFFIGITNAGTRVLRITYLFNRIPNELMGRISTVFIVFNIILRSIFIGSFSLPFFTTGSNVTWAFFICGNFILFSAVIMIKKYKAFVEL